MYFKLLLKYLEINAEKKAERWNEGLINSDHQQIYKKKSNYLCLVPKWLLKFKPIANLPTYGFLSCRTKIVFGHGLCQRW